jgi:hypothetical protein
MARHTRPQAGRITAGTVADRLLEPSRRTLGSAQKTARSESGARKIQGVNRDDDRDRLADERDRDAAARDQQASRRDLQEAVNDALHDGEPGQDLRDRAKAIRTKSAEDRQASAADRVAAAADRTHAKAQRDAELAEVIDLPERRDDAETA